MEPEEDTVVDLPFQRLVGNEQNRPFGTAMPTTSCGHRADVRRGLKTKPEVCKVKPKASEAKPEFRQRQRRDRRPQNYGRSRHPTPTSKLTRR
jgi:hypothetical protein